MITRLRCDRAQAVSVSTTVVGSLCGCRTSPSACFGLSAGMGAIVACPFHFADVTDVAQHRLPAGGPEILAACDGVGQSRVVRAPMIRGAVAMLRPRSGSIPETSD